MKQVFLTGSTGTIGSALVPLFLAEPQTKVVLLIRAEDQQDLNDRLTVLLKFWNIPSSDERVSRLRPVIGDVSKPFFGLEKSEYDQLAAHTTHIIHCAASVKLNLSIEEARANAVEPTRSMIKLAEAAQANGVLVKVDIVSTVGVWGTSVGIMPERSLPEVKDFHNTYEASKAEAELIIWKYKGKLPITIHRPSMVVGDSKTGKVIHFQVFYHTCEFFSGRRSLGIMPVLGPMRLDTIPVDYVAGAIHWASNHLDTAGEIFHLCSGPEGSIPLVTLQQQVRKIWKEQDIPVPILLTIPRGLLVKIIPVISLFVPEKTRRALKGMPLILAYFGKSQGFSNSQSVKRLEAAGLHLPPVNDYLEKVLRYYLNEKRR